MVDAMAAPTTVTTPDAPAPATSPAEAGARTPNGRGDSAGSAIRLVRHGRLPLLLLLKVGRIQNLFDANCFWARQRPRRALVRMLLGSCCVVSAWRDGRLVGFGRATSDGVFRAVLWDVVIAAEHQGQGLGRRIVRALMANPAVAAAERTYLMTTNSSGFYARLGFEENHSQQLMLRCRRGRVSGDDWRLWHETPVD